MAAISGAASTVASALVVVRFSNPAGSELGLVRMARPPPDRPTAKGLAYTPAKVTYMRRARLLHVLASAPVAVVLTVAPALSTAAVGAASIPPPYVVAIDPGHGGTDPGALGLDGLVEKDLTLDVSNRLAALLREDGVTVVMTRTTDASVSIQQRSDVANAAHAAVFLPIYFNSWTTPTPDGSVVLYPYASDIPFANDMSQAVTDYLNPDGDNDGGIVLRDDWWLEPTMPTATVESLFISNPHDAALLTQGSVRQGLAEALRSGVETYLPGILQRLQETRSVIPAKLRAASGPLAAPPATAATTAGGGERAPASKTTTTKVTGGGAPPVLPILEVLLLLAAALLAVRHRRRLIPLAGYGLAAASAWAHSSGLHHRILRRRRRRAREGGLAAGAGDLKVRPAYDDLFAESRGIWDRALPTGHGALSEDLASATLEVRGRPVKPARRPSLDELPL
jgi:N-acetylmuramoyl-L-alanine amidase